MHATTPGEQYLDAVVVQDLFESFDRIDSFFVDCNDFVADLQAHGDPASLSAHVANSAVLVS